MNYEQQFLDALKSIFKMVSGKHTANPKATHFTGIAKTQRLAPSSI